ncbi:MAG: Ig-like domain-containing protein [Paludibacteraceae bacterium]
MKLRYYIQSVLFVAIITLFIASCANRGQGPQGGPKDTIPPSVIKSIPDNKALNVSKKKIEIIFDENIIVQKVAEKVIISPPQHTAPNIQAFGRKLLIEFNDTLQPNTTYSINFSDAIVDNNENNPLKNYVFAFATGNTIDTLQISGTLINAENLNPLQGITVGIYSDFTDSAFFKKPFLRITKSDDLGKFTVPNIKEGKYILRALKDDSRDNIYQPGEGIAFNDSVLSPSVEIYQKRDTIWKDSVTVDTIKISKAVRFLPENILLRYFKENSGKKQRFVKAERKEKNHFTLFFNAPATELPSLTPLNGEWKEDPLIQKNQTLDTLTYWIKDEKWINSDTISVKMRYQKTDSTNQLVYTTDTLHLTLRRNKNAQLAKSDKNDNKPAEAKTNFLNVKTNLSGSFDVYKAISLDFDVPVKSLDSAKIHLSEMRDTIPIPVKFNLSRTSEIGLKYEIKYNWKPEANYVLIFDSTAFHSIYDTHTNKLKNDFKIKSLDDYSSLKLMLANFDSTIVFQVLNPKDEVIRSAPATAKGTHIQFLQPGDYYIRMFIDKNRNGKWDTGSYSGKRQPEAVYYYSKKLTLIKNWEMEETIDYLTTPLLEQKPKELIQKEKKENN